MAITPFTADGDTGSTSYNVAVPAAGNDRLLVAWVARELTSVTWSTPTFDGESPAASTQVVNANGNGNAITMHWWFDADLPASAGSYALAGHGDSEAGVHWAVWTGVDQSAADATGSGTSGAGGTSASATLNTVVEDSLVIGCGMAGADDEDFTNDGFGTRLTLGTAGVGNNPMLSSYTIDSTTGSDSYSYTLGVSHRIAVVGAVFAPASEGPPHAEVTFVAASRQALPFGGGATQAFNVPGSAQVGDLLVVELTGDADGDLADTLLHGDFTPMASSGATGTNCRTRVGWVRLPDAGGGDPPASYDFTLDDAEADSEANCMVFRGALAAGDPIEDVDITPTPGTTSQVAPSVDGVEGGMLGCFWASDDEDNTAWEYTAVPAGMSLGARSPADGTWVDSQSAWQQLTADAATGTRTATAAGGDDTIRAAMAVSFVVIPEPVAAAIDLSGAASTATAAAGDLDRTRTVAGVASTATAAAGDVDRDRAVSGAASTATSATGDVDRDRAFAGAASSATSAVGAVGRARPLAGTSSSATAIGPAAADRTRNLAGAASSATAAAAGDVARARAVEAAASSATAATGDLDRTRQVAGAGSSATSAAAAAARARTVAGAASTATAATGDLDRTRPLSGAASSATAARGTLTQQGQVTLAGAASSATAAAGATSLDLAFAGVASSATAAAGELARARPLDATAASATGATGAVDLARGVAGAASSATGATGDLAVQGQVTLAGTASSATSAAADAVDRARPLAGVSSTATAAAGALDVEEAGVVALAGAASTATSATGLLHATRPVAGVASSATAAVGALTGGGVNTTTPTVARGAHHPAGAPGAYQPATGARGRRRPAVARGRN